FAQLYRMLLDAHATGNRNFLAILLQPAVLRRVLDDEVVERLRIIDHSRPLGGQPGIAGAIGPALAAILQQHFETLLGPCYNRDYLYHHFGKSLARLPDERSYVPNLIVHGFDRVRFNPRTVAINLCHTNTSSTNVAYKLISYPSRAHT